MACLVPPADFSTSVVEIIDYHPRYHADFVQINRQWIEALYVMEPEDLAQLEQVDTTILGKGGQVLLARLTQPVNGLPVGAIVGTCAILPYPYPIAAGHPLRGQSVWELAKMGVSDQVRGQRIGQSLLSAVLARIKTLGGTWAYLETGSENKAAKKLYQKAGFVSVPEEYRPQSPYDRCDTYYWMPL